MSLATEVLLKTSLAARIYQPSSAPYNDSLKSYFSKQEEEVSPAGILQPQSVNELAETMKILSAVNVESNYNAAFAIRGGGHAPPAGSANIESGLTIDLRRLDDVYLTEDKSEVVAGAGTLWGDVYSHLEPAGLTLPGARVEEAGVSGLTLGGGISYFTPKEGFVCDNVVNFQVVTADGTVINANQNANSDLWRALKGGSNNFGVVTAITMRTFKKTDIWGGVIVSDYSTIPKQLETLNRLVGSEEYDPNAAIIIAAGFHPMVGKISYDSLKYTSPVEDPPFFKPFTQMPMIKKSTLRMSNLSDLAREEGANQAKGFRRLWMSTAFFNDLPMLHRVVSLWESTVHRVSGFKGITYSIFFNPILPSAMRQMAARGGNALGLTSEKTILIATLSLTWDDPGDDESIVQNCEELIGAIEAQAKETGVFHPYKYMNYAWTNQDVIAGYGDDVKAFLQQVSRKYDPHGIFQRSVPGGFKVFDRS